MMKEKLKWIPNVLCVIRLALVIVFIYFALQRENVMLYWALFVFLLAGATDVLDGYLARRNNWITELGKILDPLADKAMQCTVVVTLSIREILPFWFAAVFFIKEIVTLFMGVVVIRRRCVVMVSKWYGKTAVCLFYLTVALSILLQEYLVGNAIAYVALCLPAAVFAIGVFIAYTRYYYNAFKRPKNKAKETKKVNESL